jgi:hypothetical protein
MNDSTLNDRLHEGLSVISMVLIIAIALFSLVMGVAYWRAYYSCYRCNELYGYMQTTLSYSLFPLCILLVINLLLKDRSKAKTALITSVSIPFMFILGAYLYRIYYSIAGLVTGIAVTKIAGLVTSVHSMLGYNLEGLWVNAGLIVILFVLVIAAHVAVFSVLGRTRDNPSD